MHIWCKFGDSRSNLLKLSHRQATFLRILSPNCQNDLKVKVNDLFLQDQPIVPPCIFGANLLTPAQLCDELSCGQGNHYGRKNGQAGGRKQRQYPLSLKGRRITTTSQNFRHEWSAAFSLPCISQLYNAHVQPASSLYVCC